MPVKYGAHQNLFYFENVGKKSSGVGGGGGVGAWVTSYICHSMDVRAE